MFIKVFILVKSAIIFSLTFTNVGKVFLVITKKKKVCI